MAKQKRLKVIQTPLKVVQKRLKVIQTPLKVVQKALKVVQIDIYNRSEGVDSRRMPLTVVRSH